MTTTKAVTLRLPDEDFSRLQAKAQRAGVRPGTFARMVLHGYLHDTGPDPLEALDRLRELRERSPGSGALDPVEVVRAGRRSLSQRGEA